MSHLEGIAHQVGVRIKHVRSICRGQWGAYRHRCGVILLRKDLAPVQRRSTLAHELGHAIYGHTGTHPRWEHEADLWAAWQLIDPAEWWYAVRAYGEIRAVAAELQVLPRIAEVYAEHLSHYTSGTVDLVG